MLSCWIEPSVDEPRVRRLALQLMGMLGCRYGMAAAHDRTRPAVCLRPRSAGTCDATEGPHLTVWVAPSWSDVDRVSVTWDGEVPIIFDSTSERPDRCLTGSALGSDLLGAIEFCTGGEEDLVRDRDSLGRFRPEYSILDDLGLGHVAPLDRYVARLREWLVSRANLEPRGWRSGARFLVALTHDVDSLFDDRPSVRRLAHIVGAGLAARRRSAAASGLVEIARLLTPRRRAGPLRFNFDDWVDLERAEDVRATYHFCGDHRAGLDVEDPSYTYDEAALFGGRMSTLRGVLRTLASDGFDVGLHASIGSFHDRAALAGDVASIASAAGRTPVSVRAHHLRFDRVSSALLWEVGLRTDTSIGGMGFARGIASPHLSYSVEPGPQLLEVPTIVMDHIFFKDSRQGLPSPVAVRKIQRLLEEVRRVGGAVAVLFHTDAFEAGRKLEIYRWLIGWVRAGGGRCTTVADLAADWESRARPSQ